MRRHRRFRHHDLWFAKNVKHDDPIPRPRERVGADVDEQLHERHLESLGVETDADIGTRWHRLQREHPGVMLDVEDPWHDDHWDCEQCTGYSPYEPDEYMYDDPDPSSPAWAELWVDGQVSDALEREPSRHWYDEAWNDMYFDDYDEGIWDNPLLEPGDPFAPHVDLGREAERREAERRRRGDRYYRAHRRTTMC